MNAEPDAEAPVRIRAAVPADLPAIEAIEEAAFEPSRRSSRRVLRRALGSAFQRVMVVEVDGAVAGYLVLWPHPRTWRIYNLATAPAWRGRGLAGRLIAAAVAAARAAGARRVVLECRDEPGLVGFYEARGFRAAATLPDYYAQGEHALRMALPLA